MSKYDSLDRNELIDQLEARDWLLARYRKMTDQLEEDVEHYEECFEEAKSTVERLRNARETPDGFSHE